MNHKISRVITWLNKLKKSASQFTILVGSNHQLNDLEKVIVAIASLDFTKKALISDKGDVVDGIATGLNVLGEELYSAVTSLETTRNYLDNILQSMTDALIVVNPDATIGTVNQATLNLLGYEGQELIGKPVEAIIIKEEKLLRGTEIEYLIKKDSIKDKERTYLAKNGKMIPMLFSGSVMRDEKGEIQGIVCVAQDITERKKMEDQIRMSLKEKELLLREIHHRVKNNMQHVSSLLNLQSRHLKDKRDKALFKESQNRIRAMSLIHEKLYQSKNLAAVDLKAYLKDLANSIFQSYRTGIPKVTLKVVVEEIALNIDTTIPCGLIVNELLSNAMKYAFPEGRKGEIQIGFRSIEDDELELTISDNGIGLPDDLDYRQTESLGLQLVTDIAQTQFHGTITLDRTLGTAFQIKFKEIQYKERL